MHIIFILGFIILWPVAFWVLHKKFNQPMYCDLVWTSSFLPISLLIILTTTNILSYRDIILFLMIAIWSIRLSFLLIARIYSGKTDSRYQWLLKKWRNNATRNLAILFWVQPILGLILSLPFYLSLKNPAGYLDWNHWASLTIFIAGFLIEAYSDLSLKKHINSSNKDLPCQKGLWKYSRHPNYFGEWLIWIAFSFFALNEPKGWMGLLSPILMFIFIYYLTGIPITENRLLARIGTPYKNYQQTTSSFFPWFKK